MRPKLTYANVMATIAVFIALGGASYAALKLPKNSVGTKQLKKNAVATAKIKKEAVTGAKVKSGSLTGAQINASTLGTVPSATHADTADSANAIPAAEPTHLVGAPGEPAFQGGSSNYAPGGTPYQEVGFYKDHEGIVHLEGLIEVGVEERIFTLPPGYRPDNRIQQFNPGDAFVSIAGSGVNFGAFSEGDVFAGPVSEVISLSGITFRADS